MKINELNELIGEHIVIAREKKSISQMQLASMIHITRPTLSKWERGINQPDLYSLIMISDILDISLDALCKNDKK